jgi:hypothetical protein
VTDRPCTLTRNGERLEWQEPVSQSPFGPYTLLSDDGGVYAAVKTTTVVGMMEGNRLLFVQRRRTPPTLSLQFIEMDAARAISNPAECAQAMMADDVRHYIHHETPVTQVLLPRRVQPGVHLLRFPKSLSDLSEFLLVSYLNRQDDVPEARQAAVFCVNPILGQLQIIPLDWYNASDAYRHDGTQWITRAAREPLSGRIVGEGIRMGQFILNENATDVEEWLFQTESHLT